MAKDFEERTDTVIYNRHGQEELRVGSRTRTETDDDDNEVEITEAENIETADGTVWNSTVAEQLGKDGMLKACDDCTARSRRLFGRRQPQSRYSLAANIRRCHKCGKNVCSRDLRISTADNRVRCCSCHRWHVLFRVLTFIFFRRVQ